MARSLKVNPLHAEVQQSDESMHAVEAGSLQDFTEVGTVLKDTAIPETDARDCLVSLSIILNSS